MKSVLKNGMQHFIKVLNGYWKLLKNNRNSAREYRIIKNSDLFDPAFYLQNYPDVRDADLDPISHFVKHGWKEGRNPSSRFDTKSYLSMSSDANQTAINPLVHYILYGKAEGRSIENIRRYKDWIENFEPKLHTYPQYNNISCKWAIKPLISIIMPTYNTPKDYLCKAINSVINQVYGNWELCIADDASTEPRVRETLERYALDDARIKVVYRKVNGRISEASNSALELVTGDFTALLDHDDKLHPLALYFVAEAINNHPEAQLIYTDEDKIDENGERKDPYFKCDFNYDLFLSHNMITHLGVYRTETIKKINGFRSVYDGAQDYDLALRFIEKISKPQIIHIPRVLYHWRLHALSTAQSSSAKPYAHIAAMKAIGEHLERVEVRATVEPAPEAVGMNRVRYFLSQNQPSVEIIIPTRDGADILRQCIESILQKTTYDNYHISIIDNGSKLKKTLKFFKELSKNSRVRILRDESPFNFSRLNNNVALKSSADFVCLLNNDTEVITPDWLNEMVSIAIQPGVGCVGARLWYLKNMLQHGGLILGLGGIAGHSHKHLIKGNTGYLGRAVLTQSLSAVTGACLLVATPIYKEVNGLEEANLTVAFNDVDFCIRVREAGYRNVWTPYAELYHHESVQRGYENTPGKIARFEKEKKFIKERWGDKLLNDPFYSPNLTLDREDFSVAWPPRIKDNLII